VLFPKGGCVFKIKNVNKLNILRGVDSGMPKHNKAQTELDEQRLLFELVKNSKENIDAIAKQCSFSKQS